MNHFDEQGRAIMVDISAKEPTLRTARAQARLRLRPETLAAILDGRVTKGDVFGVARLAGIAAAKRTPDLIPLSHPLVIHHAAIDFQTDQEAGLVTVEATVRARERTGVEMEAMTAVSVAALTVYDMAKAVEKTMRIQNIRLVEKHGGLSGDVVNEPVDEPG